MCFWEIYARFLTKSTLFKATMVAVRLVRHKKTAAGKPARCFFRKWWAMTGSNCRPSRCKRDALPTELIAHPRARTPYTELRKFSKRYLLGCFLFIVIFFNI